MDLIERYLEAIRRNLPAAKSGDVIAELRDDLLSRVEEREAAAGRTLTEAEITDVIRGSGHPLVVAGRYRKYQWMIGPTIYPFYIFTLRIVLLVVAAVILAIGLASVLLAGADPVQAGLQVVGSLFLYSLVNAGIVTMIFAILERSNFVSDHLAKWTPQQLPDLGDAQPGPYKAGIEVALSLLFLLWWTGLFTFPVPPAGDGFRLEAAPIWERLYLPILALAVAGLVHNLIQWLRPRWKIARRIMAIVTAIGGVALLPMIFQAGQWMVVVPLTMPASAAAALQDSLDLALRIGVLAVGVIWILNALGEIWRLFRGARERLATA